MPKNFKRPNTCSANARALVRAADKKKLGKQLQLAADESEGDPSFDKTETQESTSIGADIPSSHKNPLGWMRTKSMEEIRAYEVKNIDSLFSADVSEEKEDTEEFEDTSDSQKDELEGASLTSYMEQAKVLMQAEQLNQDVGRVLEILEETEGTSGTLYYDLSKDPVSMMGTLLNWIYQNSGERFKIIHKDSNGMMISRDCNDSQVPHPEMIDAFTETEAFPLVIDAPSDFQKLPTIAPIQLYDPNLASASDPKPKSPIPTYSDSEEDDPFLDIFIAALRRQISIPSKIDSKKTYKLSYNTERFPLRMIRYAVQEAEPKTLGNVLIELYKQLSEYNFAKRMYDFDRAY